MLKVQEAPRTSTENFKSKVTFKDTSAAADNITEYLSIEEDSHFNLLCQPILSNEEDILDDAFLQETNFSDVSDNRDVWYHTILEQIQAEDSQAVHPVQPDPVSSPVAPAVIAAPVVPAVPAVPREPADSAPAPPQMRYPTPAEIEQQEAALRAHLDNRGDWASRLNRNSVRSGSGIYIREPDSVQSDPAPPSATTTNPRHEEQEAARQQAESVAARRAM